MLEELTSFYLYHLILITGELLIFITVFHMIYQRRSPVNMISWLLLMLLMPYVAVFLYFIFGSRKRKPKYKKENYSLQALADNNTEKSLLNGLLVGQGHDLPRQQFDLFTDATQANSALLDSISQAEHTICMSTYVFKFDAVTHEVINRLAERAKAGVEVRLLIDSLGSLGAYFMQHRFKALREAGAQVAFFMPVLKMPFRNYINLRNHRKIFLFDHCRVLSGGMNLSREYFGPQADPKRWQDVLFRVEGESVRDYSKIFASDWRYATHEKLTLPEREAIKTLCMHSHAGSQCDTRVQVAPSGPDLKGDVLYESLLNAIYSAVQRIWIVTPYFVPDEALTRALMIAHNRGVDVKLITPKNSNHTIADLARSSFMRELEEHGIAIHLYKGTMLHAKAVLFDQGAMLGSVNLDNRSLFLNYEVATFVASERVLGEIETWMQGLLAMSVSEPRFKSRVRRVMENFMRILAPQL
jgi:cardiolipin synthase